MTEMMFKKLMNTSTLSRATTVELQILLQLGVKKQSISQSFVYPERRCFERRSPSSSLLLIEDPKKRQSISAKSLN